MFEMAIVLAVFAAVVVPAGRYLYNTAAGKTVFGESVFGKIEFVIYKICSIDSKEMSWKQYAAALVFTNAAAAVICYLILRFQSYLFLNPNNAGAMDPLLSFNTVISFVTNTDLQHYAGETALSYFSQAAVITFLMFFSAATGCAAFMAFMRALSGASATVGNYYSDMVRTITRILLPLSAVVCIVLMWQGVPQNFKKTITVNTIETKMQDIQTGPVASLESIKHIGNNGGGFFSAGSASPLENPTPLSNIAEILSMMILPGACVIAFGIMTYERRRQSRQNFAGFARSEAKSIFMVMSIIFVLLLVLCYAAEKMPNRAFAASEAGILSANMEGKETRFGTTQSALFTVVSTAFTTGSVNNMHDSLNPFGGMAALSGMMLNVVFGSIGAGLMNMIMYVLLAVFLCGLMIGRTPEYLGKKIEAREMQLVALCLILHPLLILLFSAAAVFLKAGAAGISNPGFHGLTQALYEFTSSAANNGSSFAGLKNNAPFWNVTTGIVMFFARYAVLVLQIAVAGSLLSKRSLNESSGTLRTDTMTFALMLLFVVFVFNALTFLPAVSLGPVAEHLSLYS
ncbi:MAG: potassium-transporting ATPase subunit KdpA [Endomicrobia bacterium]|nr:potassium-transporting ATPase subunit KdpA [Endomicrobiia bacterium]